MSRPDAIVVGAGIVGAACAEAFAREGLRVLVLESAYAGGGTTAAAMGHVVVMDDSEAQFALTALSRRLWEERAAELPVAGEACGVGGADAALVEGEIAGLVAAGRPQAAAPLRPRRVRLRAFARRLDTAFSLRDELRSLARPDTLVCRCEDVALGRLRPEWTPRQAKLYTRAGMGPCQGRVCGAALETIFGWPADTVRPPLYPVRLDALKEADA